MKIRRLLIANRGEIAVRILRTCQKLGIETVLAASEADLDSLAARLADWTLCIGPSRPSESYLRVGTIVEAAKGTHCDAVHPGYGFLSENAALARACEEYGIVFVGPTPQQLESVGDKLQARSCAVAARVPITPGGPVSAVEEARALAEVTGYPALLKAVGGGGGRGMKRVDAPGELDEMFALAVAEAHAAFGDSRVYLERFVTRGRHVEVQVIGDGQHVVHLGDRDCSVQRRYQKLIEEAPAPCLPDALRSEMRSAAVRFAEHLNYRGLGTVEFLVDCERLEFYFLEMNARIQVEHPVTEAVTGLDLVEEQLAVAQGIPLRFRQADIRLEGHAVECRINAEDPDDGFRPTPGTVTQAEFPTGEGLRVDTHVEPGIRVTPFYDSLLAKVIAHGRDRSEALGRLRGALAGCQVSGVSTNLGFHASVLGHEEFARGGADSGFLQRFFGET